MPSYDIFSTKKDIATGVLVIEDKAILRGVGFGYEGEATGEICFNTSITGYQEILSDPSYASQIINFTFPHIGNVGVNNEDNESDKVWAKGIIVNAEISSPSNYRAMETLTKWLKKNKIVGITGIDTRELANIIREKGSQKGTLSFSKSGKHDLKTLVETTKRWSGLNGLDLAKDVTTKSPYEWSGLKTWNKEKGFEKIEGKTPKIVVIDYGVKKNILRYFSNFSCDVKVVPCDLSAEKIMMLKPDGVFLSNGPGDPAATAKYAVGIVRDLIKTGIPIFGICLGHQIISLVYNAKTKKMKTGHRGANHPVKNLSTGKIEITSQNHGFEVVENKLPKELTITHRSLFDGSIEGLRVKGKPIFSVQYHPESNPGPQDSVYLFEEFMNEIKKYGKKN